VLAACEMIPHAVIGVEENMVDVQREGELIEEIT
jgi:hypothetical protein